jgi:hypothetical protein
VIQTSEVTNRACIAGLDRGKLLVEGNSRLSVGYKMTSVELFSY